MSHILAGVSPAWVIASHEPGIEPCNQNGNGLVDALWTPETSDKTAMVLASPYLARGVGAAALAVNRGVIIGGVRVIQIHKHSLSMKILMSAGYSRKAAGAIRNTPLWHANWGKSGHLIFRKIISGIFGK